MKHKKKLKIWHDRHCKKLQQKKYHRKHTKGVSFNSITPRYTSPLLDYDQKQNSLTEDVPSSFSFLYNTEETIDFFSNFIKDIKKKLYKNIFNINSQNVDNVTVDALIYLIAIMRNIKINSEMLYTFRGNLPNNKLCCDIYNECGFMSFVKSKSKQLPISTDKMKIITGTKNDSYIASTFCRFVMDKLNKTQVDTISLQKILIELMSNVYHHAYNNDELMRKNWYIYAEYIDNCVRFVFVDTGIGIARTVRKNFIEKIQRLIGTDTSDGDLIYSTLMGDFRTETNDDHRGNGLSGVRELATTGLFRNFTVISGSGQCSISNNSKNLKKVDYNNKIYGTIFIFDVI